MSRTRSARQTARPITPAVVTGRTSGTAPKTSARKAEWETEADQAEKTIVDVRNYLAELRKANAGAQGDQDALETLLGPLVDEDAPTFLSTDAPAVATIRKALTIINEIGRRGEVADDLAHKAELEAEGIDLASLKALAAQCVAEEERADEATGKVEDLEGRLAEKMAPEEIGALLVHAGWSEPPNGWTRERVTETLEQLAWNVSLLQARGGR